MHKLSRLLGVISALLAVVIFVFAGGARSIYSGSFFVVLAVVLLANARRGQRKTSS